MSDFAWLRKIVEARTPRPWSLSPNKQFVRSVRPVFEETERLAEFVHDYDANFIATAGTIADAWLGCVAALEAIAGRDLSLGFKGTDDEPWSRQKAAVALAALQAMRPKEGV